MIALFQEIFGRSLDQNKTEQYAIDIDKHAASTHPLADWDTALVSMHVSAIARALEIADLPGSAEDTRPRLRMGADERDGLLRG